MLYYLLTISFICAILCVSLQLTTASSGDRTQFFHNCKIHCEQQNCTADGIDIQEQALKYYRQGIFDRLFQWTCADECQYGCMWRTVDAFLERNWPVPQFYGKWPFMRFLGMQEPASVMFSLFNFCMHFRMLRKFRREVRFDSPGYKLCHVFAFTCLNGWIWSMIFHTRDFELTELLDYAFAYLMVLATLYCMVIRMIYDKSVFLRGVVTLGFISYYLNYFVYLSAGKLNYSFNMKVNITTGVLSAIGWLSWCYLVRHKRPYYRKLLQFYVFFGLAMSLELLDFPPIFWTLDAHALWHLSTGPLVVTYYSFLIDDAKTLLKEKYHQYELLNKEI